MSKLAHVYIMEDRGAFKVGYSKNPENRRKSLGSHLTLVHTSAPMTNASRVEHLAHRLLDLIGKRIGGELFSSTLDEAKAAIERAERIAAGLEPDVTKPPPKPPKVTVKKSHELRKKRTLVHIHPYCIRVNDAFKAAVQELRQLAYPERPSASEVIRAAVFAELRRVKKAKQAAQS